MEQLTSGYLWMRVFISGICLAFSPKWAKYWARAGGLLWHPHANTPRTGHLKTPKQTLSMGVNLVPPSVYSILSQPASVPVIWRFLDLCGFICDDLSPLCTPPSLHSRCPSASQGLCVFWHSENKNNHSSWVQISIYHPKLLTQVLWLHRKWADNSPKVPLHWEKRNLNHHHTIGWNQQAEGAHLLPLRLLPEADNICAPQLLVLLFIKNDYNKSVFSSGFHWICGDTSPTKLW